ncbi:MAG: hypothetical protein LLG44_13740 [Chloroflexi bacterium]|nr:hypothetical protein [Chloroflexota bacterium]
MRSRDGVHAAFATAWILGLEGYWFLAADRSRVFLYGHLGAGPFDPITRSRYWMSGLVAAGLLLAPYLALALLARRRRKDWLPVPLRTAAYASLPITAGALLFACAWGEPRLPLGLGMALACTSTVGAYLALRTARRLYELGWAFILPALDGLALVPTLALFHALELPGQGLSITNAAVWGAALGSLFLSAVGLAGMMLLYRRYRQAPAAPAEVLAEACTWTYLALPALHHLIETPPGYKYITTADNLFARNWLLQLATWALAALLAWGAGLFRRRRE